MYPVQNFPQNENGTKCTPKFYTRKTMKKVPNLALFFIKKIVKNVEKKSILWYKYKEKNYRKNEAKNGGKKC